jgi:hypothetical protein
MVTKTTFKKKFPDVKVQKLQTSVVFSRQQVEETVLKMCDWGGISCALVCAIPIVAIICDTVKKVFEMKYKKGDEN